MKNIISIKGASLMAQMVNNWPAMQETQVQSHPLEGEIATHSNILAWRILWTEEPGRLHSPWGHKELDTAEATENTYIHTHTHK